MVNLTYFGNGSDMDREQGRVRVVKDNSWESTWWTGWMTRPFPGQETLQQGHISGKDQEFICGQSEFDLLLRLTVGHVM